MLEMDIGSAARLGVFWSVMSAPLFSFSREYHMYRPLWIDGAHGVCILMEELDRHAATLEMPWLAVVVRGPRPRRDVMAVWGVEDTSRAIVAAVVYLELGHNSELTGLWEMDGFGLGNGSVVLWVPAALASMLRFRFEQCSANPYSFKFRSDIDM